MTHTIHRRLNDRDEDYVLLLRSKAGFNRDGSGKCLIQLLELMEPLGPVSYGNPVDGSTLRTDPEDIKNDINDNDCGEDHFVKKKDKCPMVCESCEMEFRTEAMLAYHSVGFCVGIASENRPEKSYQFDEENTMLVNEVKTKSSQTEVMIQSVFTALTCFISK